MRSLEGGRRVSIHDSGQAEKDDEPGKLQLGFIVTNRCGSQSYRDNPKGAGQLDGGADDQSFRAIPGSGADDGAGVMNGERGPESELRLRKSSSGRSAARSRVIAPPSNPEASGE